MRKVELIISCNKNFIRHLIDTLVTMEDIDMEEIDDYFRELRGERRSRATARTPGSGRRRKTPRTPVQRGRSRSRGTTGRQLSFRSPSNKASQYYREAVKLTSAPKDERTKFDVYHLNKGKSLDEIDHLWARRKSGKYKLKTRKVRHKNARSTLKKMPRGGKPYARGRQSMRKPKGAYRGAVMPRWAKGETKHVLWRDDQAKLTAAAGTTATVTAASETGIHEVLDIGDIQSWSLNPIAQGNARNERNGASVDGTYLRIQGHLHNISSINKDAMSEAGSGTDAKQRAYVRMLVLAVKGGRGDGHVSLDRPKANLDITQLFKKIDGTVVGFEAHGNTATAGKSAARIRTLQLGVNKAQYTVLADRKFELSGATEGFGASDRLFDMKMPVKQKTTFADGNIDSWEKNQLCFVVMTVDPNMNDSAIATGDSRKAAIQLEFESKYSYKDF